jgi:hypothetical protein
MNRSNKKLRLRTESIRTLSNLQVAVGGLINVPNSVGCLTKDKYTGCPACPTQPTRIFCDD